MTEKRYSDGTLAKWYYSQTNVISDGNNEYYLRNKESVKDWNYNELLGTNDLVDELNRLSDENEQLQARNDRQAKQLDKLYHLIEEKDWIALSDIIDDFKRCEEQLQKEWGTYCE